MSVVLFSNCRFSLRRKYTVKEHNRGLFHGSDTEGTLFVVSYTIRIPHCLRLFIHILRHSLFLRTTKPKTPGSNAERPREWTKFISYVKNSWDSTNRETIFNLFYLIYLSWRCRPLNIKYNRESTPSLSSYSRNFTVCHSTIVICVLFPLT